MPKVAEFGKDSKKNWLEIKIIMQQIDLKRQEIQLLEHQLEMKGIRYVDREADTPPKMLTYNGPIEMNDQ